MKYSVKRSLTKLSIPIGLLLLLCGFASYNLILSQSPFFSESLNQYARGQAAFDAANITVVHNWLSQTQLFLGLAQWAIFLLAGLTQLRRPIIHRLFWFALLAQLLLWPAMIYLWIGIPRELMNLDSVAFKAPDRTDFLVYYFWIFLAVFAVQIIWALILGLRETTNIYWGTVSQEPEIGDVVLENVRSHGQQPVMRKSVYLSLMTHVLVIVILPWLMTLRGCMKPYNLPQGTGENSIEGAKAVKVVKKKKEKKKRMVLNVNSAIIFTQPEIDDSLAEELNEATMDQYQADTDGKKGDGKGGPLGKGGKGKGGWPQGVKDAEIRFIRLSYGGGLDWNQDMGEGSDYNFLLKIKQLTGFNIAKSTESIPVTALGRFPKNHAPPFVYITGGSTSGSIALSNEERKALKKYLLVEGGLLFADAGGLNFDRNFRNMLASVIPEFPIVKIAHDDEIFMAPYEFPNGSPPLWHHAGSDAFGVKDSTGRWIVFYHPGDINDAWKNGHSGAKEADAEQAFKMGVNVVAYAFRQYYSQHFNDQ